MDLTCEAAEAAVVDLTNNDSVLVRNVAVLLLLLFLLPTNPTTLLLWFLLLRSSWWTKVNLFTLLIGHQLIDSDHVSSIRSTQESPHGRELRREQR